MSTDQREKDKRMHKLHRNRAIVYSIMGIIYLALMLWAQHYLVVNQTEPDLDLQSKAIKALSNIIASPFEIFPPNLTLLVVMLAAAGAVAAIIYTNVLARRQRRVDNLDTVNGDGHIMTPKELKEYNILRTDPFGKESNNGEKNIILSKEMKLTMDTSAKKYNGETFLARNCNILILGCSGSGKTRYFVGPNLLQFNANYVITDPSGEILSDYGKALEYEGYKVKVFNLTDVYASNRYNPFHYIKTEKDALILVNTLIKNTTPPKAHKGDDFWEKMETCLITACVLYLWHTQEDERQQTFEKVIDLLHESDIDENDSTVESPLDRMFADLEAEDPENLAVTNYKTFKMGAGKTLKETLLSVGVRLQAFKLADIKYLTAKDELELDRFADTKQALFIIIPTGDSTFNFLAAMLYSQLFMTLYTHCETNAEFGHMAVLDDSNILKVEHAEGRDDTERAKNVIASFCASVKKGTKIEYNAETSLYEIRTQDTNELVAWRGIEADAKKLQKRLSEIHSVQCARKCPNHVRMILDEFANIGEIPDFDKKLATIRKYSISCSIILQGITQLKTMYEKDWNTLANNCDTKVLLGSDDTETNKFIIEKIGKKTTKTASFSYKKDIQEGMNVSRSSLEVLTVDQIARMSDMDCLVLVRSHPVYIGPKYDLLDHPNYEIASETRGKFKINSAPEAANRRQGPHWKQKQLKAQQLAEASTAESTSTEERELKRKQDEQKKNVFPDETGNMPHNESKANAVEQRADGVEEVLTPAMSNAKTSSSSKHSAPGLTPANEFSAEEFDAIQDELAQAGSYMPDYSGNSRSRSSASPAGMSTTAAQKEQDRLRKENAARMSANQKKEKSNEPEHLIEIPEQSFADSLQMLMRSLNISPNDSTTDMEQKMAEQFLSFEPTPEELEIMLTE